MSDLNGKPVICQKDGRTIAYGVAQVREVDGVTYVDLVQPLWDPRIRDLYYGQ